MSAPVTTTPTFSLVIIVPTDGDPATAASILQHVQPLANNDAFLQQQVVTAGAYISSLLSAFNNMGAVRQILTAGNGVSSEGEDQGGGFPNNTWQQIPGATLAFATSTVGDQIHVDLDAPFSHASAAVPAHCASTLSSQIVAISLGASAGGGATVIGATPGADSSRLSPTGSARIVTICGRTRAVRKRPDPSTTIQRRS